MTTFSPAAWAAWAQRVEASVAAEDRCVNEGGKRADGTFCREVAEASGWCKACWAEVGPVGDVTGTTPSRYIDPPNVTDSVH